MHVQSYINLPPISEKGLEKVKQKSVGIKPSFYIVNYLPPKNSIDLNILDLTLREGCSLNFINIMKLLNKVSPKPKYSEVLYYNLTCSNCRLNRYFSCISAHIFSSQLITMISCGHKAIVRFSIEN